MGHLGMVELLLKNGGNLEVCGAKGSQPLHLALLARHEEIAIFLFNKINNPDSLIAVEAGYTSLHTACLRQLLKSARVFLESGADVHARTSKRNTPLHLALQPGALDTSNDASRSCTLELIMLLLEFGSIKDSKAYRLGRNHPDPQVRDIFQEHKGLSHREACFISMGRCSSVGTSSDTDCVSSLTLADLSRLWVEQLADTGGEAHLLTTAARNMVYDELFPAIDSSRSLNGQQPLASAWDASKVKGIRETLPVTQNTKAEISSTSFPVEPFPKLIGRESLHPLQSAAQSSWRDLRNPKMQLAITEACTDSKGKIEESESQAEQAQKRKRWRPLQLS